MKFFTNEHMLENIMSRIVAKFYACVCVCVPSKTEIHFVGENTLEMAIYSCCSQVKT